MRRARSLREFRDGSDDAGNTHRSRLFRQNKILRFEGHYHGWHEFVDLGMNAPYDKPTSLGILPGPWNRPSW